MQNNRFEALSKVCLNNWHYIERKVLSFHEEVNFFTGHSGSGKSTVIDALQILLYANTDGRGFFNKAATDDSDRSLIEYLRGMVNSDEDGGSAYLRNQNFSTTIVMELKRTDTQEFQSIGVVFDVQPSSNEIVNRVFFWHKGPLFDNQYRSLSGAMTSLQIKEYLRNNYEKEDYYIGSTNERFREKLYGEYLGGLDKERFPKLFKRAIPFKMNIRLEEFVKEYICMEKDIHIEDMQESVVQYGRMRRKIDDTYEEIKKLEEIKKFYNKVVEERDHVKESKYFICSMEIEGIKDKLEKAKRNLIDKKENLTRQKQQILEIEEKLQVLDKKKDDLTAQMLASGYEQIKDKLKDVNEWIERLESSAGKWKKTEEKLLKWKEIGEISTNLSLNIDRFGANTISEEQLKQLQEELETIRKNIQEEKVKVDIALNTLGQEEILKEEEKKKLLDGRKAYPKEVEEVRALLEKELEKSCNNNIPVYVLADLLEIKDDEWRNAVEGYLANDKLLLVVEPQYVKKAMSIYEELDKKKYHKVAILDTKKVLEDNHRMLDNALCEEVIATKDYINAYIQFKLGGVVKCNSIEELRMCRVGITKECVLYHSYKLQHINPEHYTTKAYIGEESRKGRIHQIQLDLDGIKEKKQPLIAQRKEYDIRLKQEFLSHPIEEYVQWKSDIEEKREKEIEKNNLVKRLEDLKSNGIDRIEKEINNVKEEILNQTKQKDLYYARKGSIESEVSGISKKIIELESDLVEKEKQFEKEEKLQEKVDNWLLSEKEKNKYINFDLCKKKFEAEYEKATNRLGRKWEDLKSVRWNYIQCYPNRTQFQIETLDNSDYDSLLSRLKVDDLESYRERANEQARKAVEQFKNDFAFKIRDAIKEAKARRDELNRMISRLNFGKDKYRFIIGKNKGYDGKYYDMFMSENLEVNPRSFSNAVENQMDLFTIAQESQYEDEIKDLMDIFIPPDNATPEEMEIAKQNMEKYADYRTYLSFDMEQIIEGEEPIRLRLSKMLRKNSGGEGQNPLYVALLASFAQMYQIETSAKLYRNPTIRLVILDEAFSKMDGEKVASCIQLIRGLGFQAIISATNDKIQNYIENVDKTFLFANPNKKMISIQEFERKEFDDLSVEIED